MQASNTWENFPYMPYMTYYANQHSFCLCKHSNWHCKCLDSRCPLFLYVMGTLFTRFPIFVRELVKHAFLREFSIFIACREPAIFVVLLFP